jgi:DeoR family fructose operon transcriptional repressor
MTADKERIAKAALAELPDEGVLLLDAGTTTAALADLIPVDSQVRVVTNSLPIAMTLGLRPALTVLLVGGRVRARTLALVDTWALRTIEGMLVDVAFMATNGISLERGLTTPDTAEAAVKHAMVAAARRVVLLADHTKFGLEHFDRFATLEDVHAVYTDTGLDEDLAARIEARGPRVVRA